MDQQPEPGGINIKGAFNRAQQNAVGDGARVNIGASGNADNVNEAPGTTAGDISITDAFNDASLNAVGKRAQINAPGMADTARIPRQMDQIPARAIWPGAQPAPAGTGARKIIISYSHEDRQWLYQLKKHLVLLEYQQKITHWDDTQIAVGMNWRQAITDALNSAYFALLLVSEHFLASDFIMRYELPLILQRHSQGMLTILPLVLSPCLFKESPLERYQAFDSARPLSFLSPSEQNEVLVRVVREIQRVAT